MQGSLTDSTYVSEMRKNPERVAWAVLLTAFAIFCVLAAGIPLGLRWYIINATRPRHAALEVISGTVLVEEPGAGEAIGVTDKKDDVVEGATITADASSQAILTLYDDSTVIVYGGTQIVLSRMRSSRFDISPKPGLIELEVKGGRIRVGVAPPVKSPPIFEVFTPHASARLDEGSYSVDVGNTVSQFTVRSGQAMVESAGQTVAVRQSERATVELGQPPAGPLPAAEQLIVNGDFRQPLSVGWQVYNEQGADGGEIDGTVEIVDSGDRRAASFSRLGEDGNHCETGIIQRIDKDVRDFSSLNLHVDVRLIYQSLSGGGYLSSEFPVIVRLDYKDAFGKERFWTHGFYYQNQDNYPIQGGEQIRRYLWYPYESGNLMEILASVKPVYVTSIRIYASGWDYHSMVSEVGLVAQ